MMNLRHLEYFLAVARERHFTRAAQSLYVSQPTLSQQIGQLEKELGAPLFDRTGKRVRLTAAGALFEQHAKNIVAEIKSTRVALDELAGLERGELRIGVVQTVGAYLVPALVARFNALHAGVTLQIDELSGDGIETGLLEGDLDIGIGFTPPQQSDIEAHVLFEEDLVLVVPASHRLAKRKRLKLSELDGEPMVLMPRAFCTRRLWDEAAQRVGIAPRVVIEMNSIGAIVSTVCATEIATILPALTLQAGDWPGEKLRAVKLSDPTPRRQVGLMWRRGSYRCAASRAFAQVTANWVKQNFVSVGCEESEFSLDD